MNPSFDPDLPLPVGNFLLPAEGVIEMHPSERQGLGASARLARSFRCRNSTMAIS